MQDCEMPALWGICPGVLYTGVEPAQGVLHTGVEPAQEKERDIARATMLDGWSHLSLENRSLETGHEATGFGICPAEFQASFGPIFQFTMPQFLPLGMEMDALCSIHWE